MKKPRAPSVDFAGALHLPHYREAPNLDVELGFWIDSADQMIEILKQLRAACVELQRRIAAEAATGCPCRPSPLARTFHEVARKRPNFVGAPRQK